MKIRKKINEKIVDMLFLQEREQVVIERKSSGTRYAEGFKGC